MKKNYFYFILVFNVFFSFGQSFDEKIEQLINQNINTTVDDSSVSQNDESLVLTEEVKKEDNDSNGLEEFGLNEEEPNLFDTSTNNLSSEEELNHERSEDNSEEDDYEIPAFLRRQKN